MVEVGGEGHRAHEGPEDIEAHAQLGGGVFDAFGEHPGEIDHGADDHGHDRVGEAQTEACFGRRVGNGQQVVQEDP